MVVTVSHAGYVKRVPLSTYRAQKRGGKGRAGMATKEEDFVNDIFVASTKAYLQALNKQIARVSGRQTTRREPSQV